MKNGIINFIGFLFLLPLLFIIGFPIYFLMFWGNTLMLGIFCLPWFGSEICKSIAMNPILPLIETIIFLAICFNPSNNQEGEHISKISNIEINVKNDTDKIVRKKIKTKKK